MSSIIFSTGYVSGTEKKSENYSGKKKIYFFLTAFILLLIASEIVFQFIIAPRIVINKIQVYCSAGFHLTDEDIISLAGLGGKEYYFSVSPLKIEERLLSHPLIKEARVEKVFPAALKIYIGERIPLAMALVNINGRTIPAAFDNEGVIFEIGKSVTDFQIPVISGLRFVDLKLGLRLPQELNSYLNELYTLKNNSPALFNQISEFKFINKSNSDYDVIIFPSGSNLRVRTGSIINENLLKQIFVVLDIIEKNGLKSEIEELDFRSGQAVYRVKEG